MVAISYRREDTGPLTGRICDRLQSVFGRDRVFMDIDSIPFGADFRAHISNTLERCEALLVVIGPRWLGPLPNGANRIDDETDFVRLEVTSALKNGTLVIPLLVDQTSMPSVKVLPDDIRDIAFRNAMRIDSGIDFNHHVERLCRALKENATRARHKPKPTAAPQKTGDDVTPAKLLAEPAETRRRFSFRSLLLLLLRLILTLVGIYVAAMVGGGVSSFFVRRESDALFFAASTALAAILPAVLLWRRWGWKWTISKPVP